MSCPSCINGSCPEVVPVTLEQNTIEFDGAEADVTLAAVDAQHKDVSIQLAAAAQMEVTLRWVEDPNYPDRVSPQPPDIPGWSEVRVMTDATGLYTFRAGNTMYPNHTWHLVAVIAGFLVEDTPIAVNLG